MNQILTDAIRDVVTDVKPEVIVDLGEHIIFTQTFEAVTRDLNKVKDQMNILKAAQSGKYTTAEEI